MKNLLFISFILIMFIGCDKQPKETVQVKFEGFENFEIIADTIINDVIIKNPDNNEWTDFCLRKLDKTSLVIKFLMRFIQENLLHTISSMIVF